VKKETGLVSAYHERDTQVHRLFHTAGKAENRVSRNMESGLMGSGSSEYPCPLGQLAAKDTAPFGDGIPHTSGPVGAVTVCRKVSVVGRTPPCDWSGACHRNSKTEGACWASATSPFGAKFIAYLCCSLPDQFLQNTLQHPLETQHPNGAHQVCIINSRAGSMVQDERWNSISAVPLAKPAIGTIGHGLFRVKRH
jgi:hypothetical protein